VAVASIFRTASHKIVDDTPELPVWKEYTIKSKNVEETDTFFRIIIRVRRISDMVKNVAYFP
jgi:hypothetical protein